MLQLGRLIVAACALLLAAAAQAQKIDGPVKFIVGYPPGGASDKAARLVADAMRERYGTTVIVENKTGAGGRVAAQSFKATPANETALMIGNPAVNVVAPLVFKNVGYDPATDFVPVAQVSRYEFGIAVGAAVAASSAQAAMSSLPNCSIVSPQVLPVATNRLATRPDSAPAARSTSRRRRTYPAPVHADDASP